MASKAKTPPGAASGNDNGAKRTTKKRAFPFTTIIVTNPDEASARSAQRLLEETLQRYLNNNNANGSDSCCRRNVRIFSTCDPYGARCGSFGGTLAALECMTKAEPETEPNTSTNTNTKTETETVLCLHAGGDSSRCPLSMILGKAWTNLPSENYRNPIAWLIHQLEDLFYRANLPSGSLLVTATDCLISLGDCAPIGNHCPLDCNNLDPSTVLGVAVPAPLGTAKNHGVYVMPETTFPTGGGDSYSSAELKVETPIDVWQKPSVDQMSSSNSRGGNPRASFGVPSRSGQQAWIDVGIVIFFPNAFQTLTDLSNGLLSMCTRSGLQAAFQRQHQFSTIESFAKANALKVDLYTDILHNLPFGKTSTTAMEDVVAESSAGNELQASLRKILSALPLQVLVVPEGSFLHLGTTFELIEFITTTSSTNRNAKNNATTTGAVDAIPSVMDRHVTQSLARALRLNPRFETLSAPIQEGSNCNWNNNTTLYSTFPSDSSQTQLGSSTFVEYSDLQDYESVTIGDHCMLSGWRRKNSSSSDETVLEIPNGMSVQLLPLAGEPEGEEKFVIMALGTIDAIKSPISTTKLYGVSFLDLLKRTGISYGELGFGDILTKEDNIWTAKIHPIVSTGKNFSISFSDFFAWLEPLRNNDIDLHSNESFSNWLSIERVSLRDIHGIADASKEWVYRFELEAKIWKLDYQRHINSIVELLRNRCQTVPCDLEWLIEVGKNPTDESTSSFAALSALVAALEDLALNELSKANYDISGRALMLASATIADFPPHLIVGGDASMDENHGATLNVNKSLPTDRIRIVRNIFGVRESSIWHPTKEAMLVCSEKLERLALNMIELTITAGFRRYLVEDHSINDPAAKPRMKRRSEIVRDKFVLSVAPVRVDLAGGWSDTPPITYEFGGSVTGMAVLVDGCFPLSCRCRLVSGKTGVFLRTELRDISSGSLLSTMQDEITEMSHLSDFRDPSASCALLKAALVCLGMVSEEEIRINSLDIQKLINEFCSSPKDNMRIEIITTSLLGMGTGMGTSSILGACILQSLATCVGIGRLSEDCLIHAVLVLEQLLSSGGGWQDQAHGILPGIKTVTSAPTIPIDIDVNPVSLSIQDLSTLEGKLLFAYTGKTRLAKNILQQVLRRWARRTDEIVETVKGLVDHSVAVRKALETNSWDKLGEYMYQAYKLKCVMAGEGSGAEPESVKIFVSEMMERNQIAGATLCGAGGGGFLLLLLSENANRASVERTFEESIAPLNSDFEDFCFHDCSIAKSGLFTSILPENDINEETYMLSWQQPSVQTE